MSEISADAIAAMSKRNEVYSCIGEQVRHYFGRDVRIFIKHEEATGDIRVLIEGKRDKCSFTIPQAVTDKPGCELVDWLAETLCKVPIIRINDD